MRLRKQATTATGATVLAAMLVGLPAPALADAAVQSAMARIAVANDPLEPAIVVSTEGVNRSKRGFLGVTHNDSHLRAVVDRQNGAVRYELRQKLEYIGNFRDFQQAHYQSNDGVGTATLTRLDENQIHCSGVDSQAAACFEVVSFEVPEAALRATGDDAWTFKFKPRLGAEHRAQIPRTEIQALLSAVETVQAGRPVALARQD